MQISLSDLSALATALSSADSFDYSSNTSLYVLDSNNDGKIGKQEFVDMLVTISGLNDVNTTGSGKYAQAYADELGNMSTPVSLASIQTAITTGNTYAVDAPQIVNTSFSFDGEDSSHSSSLGLSDGLGNTLGNTNLINSFSALLDDNTDATSKFQLTDNGSIELNSGVDIQDLDAGTYTFSITSVDNNIPTYGLSSTTSVTLTVSNHNGCIVSSDVADNDFTTNEDASTSIDGATVTINGNHSSQDLLFVKNATKTTTSDNVSYSNIGNGVTGIYDKSTGVLTFSGSTTEANWINIFKKLDIFMTILQPQQMGQEV